MDETNTASIWSLVTIIGPIIFVLIVIWAVTHNRRSRQQRERTEQATRELYERSDQQSKARDADG